MARASGGSPDLERFYEAARAYCDFMDSLAGGRPPEMYETLMHLLASLGRDVLDLPEFTGEGDEAGGGFEGGFERPGKYDRGRLSEEESARALGSIEAAISPEVASLGRMHKDSPEDFMRATTLGMRLSDTYEDVAYGVRVYEIGTREAVEEAAWIWRWGYQTHWGPHLFQAMRSIHEILYELVAG